MDLCPRRTPVKVKPSRNLDVYYDTTMCFSSKKDYQKAIRRAADATASFVVRPCFSTMFSDIRPRQKSIVQLDWTGFTPETDVYVPWNPNCNKYNLGARRPLYFKQPIIKTQQVSPDQKSLAAEATSQPCDVPGPPTRSSKIIQTDFRESETQTEAWAHDVIAVQGMDLLKLDWLSVQQFKWVGKEEIAQLERFWQKHAWEEVVPHMKLVSKWQQSLITHAIAANDIAAQEGEIDVEHRCRLLLAAENLVGQLMAQRRALHHRLQRFANLLQENRATTLNYLKHQLCRSMRKLSMKHRGIETKYKSRLSRDLLTEIMNQASNIHAPQLRFGDPVSNFRKPQVHCRYLTQLNDFQILEKKIETLEIPSRFEIKKLSDPKKFSCKRGILKFEKGLRHQEIGVSGKYVAERPSSKFQPLECIETPTENEPDDWEEEQRQACLVLQKVIKGRAIQTTIAREMSK